VVRPGLELHLIEIHLIAYDTGERIVHAAALVEAIGACRCARCSTRPRRAAAHSGPIGTTFLVAGKQRRRGLPGRDVAEDRLYFLNLSQLREALVEAFRHSSRKRRPSRGPSHEAAGPLRRDRGHLEVERLRRLADRLAGKRIVHVNSTRSGGGVAEILGWMIPLMEELGISAAGSGRRTARLLSRHEGLSQRLQGLRCRSRRATLTCTTRSPRNAQRLNLEADIVFVHDPQPIYLPQFTPAGQVGRWIWRCHIDASRPDRAIWKYLETPSRATVRRSSRCPPSRGRWRARCS